MTEYARQNGKKTDMVTKTCPKFIIKELELGGGTAQVLQSQIQTSLFPELKQRENVPVNKNLIKVTNKAQEQDVKIVKRYQQRHQSDVKTMS